MKSNINRNLVASTRCRNTLVLTSLLLLLVLLLSTSLSCGSSNQEAAEQQASQEENAQALGQMMAYRNPVEGELNEPVDAVIKGEVTEMAEVEEELWLMLEVQDFRCLGVPAGSLTMAPDSEACIRMYIPEEAEPIQIGDVVEMNVMVAKSTEGPVILGMNYTKL